MEFQIGRELTCVELSKKELEQEIELLRERNAFLERQMEIQSNSFKEEKKTVTLLKVNIFIYSNFNNLILKSNKSSQFVHKYMGFAKSYEFGDFWRIDYWKEMSIQTTAQSLMEVVLRQVWERFHCQDL